MFQLHRPWTTALALGLTACASDIEATGLSAQLRSSADCPAIDWSDAPHIEQNTSRLSALQWQVRQSCLYVRAQYSTTSESYALVIDSDGDAATGYRAWNWAVPNGADYLVVNGALLRSTGLWPAPTDALDSTPFVDIRADSMEIRVDLAAIGEADEPNLWLGLEFLDGGNPSDQIPGRNLPLVHWPSETRPVDPPLEPVICPEQDDEPPVNDTTATSGGDFKHGLIVPAYLNMPAPTDSAERQKELNAQWAVLERNAASARAAQKDFWVVVNGEDNGPPGTLVPSNRLLGVKLYEAIQENGGRVIGYVHSIQGRSPNRVLRPLQDVMKDINEWLRIYPALDGIFIDEFWPQFELVADGEAAAQANIRVRREGLCNAPNAARALTLTPESLDPAGGFYARLTSWIRRHYPHLRIIGNPGVQQNGWQTNYATLVDVLVGYEQANSSLDLTLAKPRLDIQPSQATLIYNASYDDYVTNHIKIPLNQYPYVYFTDDNEPDPWNPLASYLDKQVTP